MVIRAVIAFALGAVLCIPADPAKAQVCKASEAVTEFGSWITPNIELNATDDSREFPVEVADGRKVDSVRFLFRVMAAGADNEPWSLVIRDGRYRALAALTQKDFADEHGVVSGARWTGRLPGSVFRVELSG